MTELAAWMVTPGAFGSAWEGEAEGVGTPVGIFVGWQAVNKIPTSSARTNITGARLAFPRLLKIIGFGTGPFWGGRRDKQAEYTAT